jgi:LDH2 family malate/lactate/ureidoglycolate dehydrogenase
MVLVVAVLLVLLMLPLRALGGSTLADAGPAVGQTYIVKAGDTLASIAQRTGVGNVAVLTSQLATETGSSVVVPGEHIRIP